MPSLMPVSRMIAGRCLRQQLAAVAVRNSIQQSSPMLTLTTMQLQQEAAFSSSSSQRSALDDLLDPKAPCPILGTPAGQSPKEAPKRYLECGLCEDVLKFKTSSYGKSLDPPFIHTNEHRVYLLVDLDQLPLDDLGKSILQQVVGHSRYNTEKGVLKLQSVHFPSRIENKRYLVRMLDKLVLSCQRLAKSLPMEEAAVPEPTDATGDALEKAVWDR